MKATDHFYILNFHGVGIPHNDVPDSEIPYWISIDRFSQIIKTVARLREKGNPIHLTFDDGNISDRSIAAPILVEHGLTADFFILAGRLNDPQYLSSNDIHALQSMGMGIGLHGRDHLDWRKLSASQLKTEVVTARQTLAKISNDPIDKVGIPFGSYNHAVISRLKAEGFTQIFTSDGGPARASAQVQPRTTLRSNATSDMVNEIASQTQSVKERLRRAVIMYLKQHII